MELIKIKNVDGELLTNSRNIAHVFGKNHSDVIKALNHLYKKISNNFRLRNYSDGSFKDGNGDEQRLISMNKDGFAMLVMGFTGIRAAEFKESYIEMFNKMEDELRRKLPKNYKEALIALVNEVEEKEKIELELKEAQPKIDFVNHIETSKDSISVADFAKLLHKNGVKLGQNRLFKWLYDQKYLMDSDKPYQKWMDQGLFEIKKISFINGRREEKTAHKVMVTGKGQIKLTEVLSTSGQIQF